MVPQLMLDKISIGIFTDENILASCKDDWKPTTNYAQSSYGLIFTSQLYVVYMSTENCVVLANVTIHCSCLHIRKLCFIVILLLNKFGIV